MHIDTSTGPRSPHASQPVRQDLQIAYRRGHMAPPPAAATPWRALPGPSRRKLEELGPVAGLIQISTWLELWSPSRSVVVEALPSTKIKRFRRPQPMLEASSKRAWSRLCANSGSDLEIKESFLMRRNVK